MKVLVTGSEGYIGQHLCQMIEQIRPEIELYRIDKDMNDSSIKRLYVDITESWQLFSTQDEHFDAVIHLAALVKVGESVKTPSAYYDTNINGTRNVIHNLSYDNFIYASTGAASSPDSPYGYSKLAGEHIVRELCPNYTIFRFYNVIGSYGFAPTNPEGLMLNLLKAKDWGQFTIFGSDYNTKDGTCVREYVHVNDICRALIKAIDKPSNQVENLAYNDARTTKEIVELFLKVNEIDCNVIYGPRRPGDLEACYLENPSSYMERNYTYEEMLKI